MHKLLLAATLLGGIAAVPATATVLTFDSYTPLNSCGTSVSTGGLTFTQSSGICVSVWDPNPLSSNGTPGLIYGYGNLIITVTGGGVFSLGNFLAGISWYSAETSYLINAVGTYADNTTVNGSFTIVDSFSSYFAGGGYFKQIEFSGLPDGYVAIDNFDVDVIAGGVPEPASWAMLIAGFGLVGAGMRRRRTAVAA